jgi:hypothetical protein
MADDYVRALPNSEISNPGFAGQMNTPDDDVVIMPGRNMQRAFAYDRNPDYFYLAQPRNLKDSGLKLYEPGSAKIRGRREDVEHFFALVNDYRVTANPESRRKALIIQKVAYDRLVEFKKLRKAQEVADYLARMKGHELKARNYSLPAIVLPPINFGDAPAAAAVPAGGAGGPSGDPSDGSSDGSSDGPSGGPSGNAAAAAAPLVGGRRRQRKQFTSRSRKNRSKSRKSRKNRNRGRQTRRS